MNVVFFESSLNEVNGPFKYDAHAHCTRSLQSGRWNKWDGKGLG
jgi:hypothetical protein